MLYLTLFFFGSAVGSFLNVLIYRLESFGKLRTILIGRSYCPHCKKQIRWYDNIPLLSFFILAGKCRDCGQKISWQYPLVEAATGILFLAIYFLSAPSIIPILSSVVPAEAGNQILINLDSRWNLSRTAIRDGNDIWVALAYLFIIFSGLLAILVYDFKHYIIPNKIIYPLIGMVLAFNVLSFLNLDLFKNLSASWRIKIENFNSWQEIVLSLLIPIFFLSLIMISRGKWMGFGDVKLALFMALFLGWPDILVGTAVAFWLGTLVSLPLVLAGKKGMQSQVPFGPFLIIGAFIAYFWGGQIVDWYLKLGASF